MKTLARVGAAFSFTCFFLAGAWVIAIAHVSGPDWPIITVLGLCLLGLAFFLGPILWLAGEKFAPKQDTEEPHRSTPMKHDKRIFALVSIGLLVTTFLGPFIIARFGRHDMAVGFGLVAGLLTLLFGALSWSDPIGKTVTVALSLLVVVVGGGAALIHQVRSQRMSAEETATRAPAPPEGAREK